jgi:Tol biopolymer transport system component
MNVFPTPPPDRPHRGRRGRAVILTITASAALAATALAAPADAQVSGPNGRIAFTRFDQALGDVVTYTANPDGSRRKLLFRDGPSSQPRWSPDGGEVLVGAPCTDGTETCAATIVDPDTGAFRQFHWPDPTLETPCGVWSADGQRIVCEGFGVTDPERNGIYTIRASDGGGLTRVTSNPGGNDIPGDYAPDGRIVFVRADESGPVGLFVVAPDGSGLQQITPTGFLTGEDHNPRWSPTGDQIVFTIHNNPDVRKSIWVVNADGSGLHELPIAPACGGEFSDPQSIGCGEPAWSPDGQKIIFSRVSADGRRLNVYTVNADGSGLVRVTDSGFSSQPDWGVHPLVR